MATTETLSVQLAGGGEVSLIIEADFLELAIDDFRFVQDLAHKMRLYTAPASSPPVVAVVEATEPPKPRVNKAASTKAPAAAKPATAAGGSKYDYGEVARIAAAAQRANLPMGKAVSQRFQVSDAMGSFLVVEARKRGHDIPKLSKGGRKPTGPSNVTPITKVEPVADAPVGTRAFTPDDTLRILQGG